MKGKAEGETTFQALFIFCNIQSCHGLDNMAGRLWGFQSLKKDTAIYMESFMNFSTLRPYNPILHELYNVTFVSGEVANDTAVLGLLYMQSSLKKNLCKPLLVLESTFPGIQGVDQVQTKPYHDHGDAETVTNPQQELREVAQRVRAPRVGGSESILLGHGVTLEFHC